MWPKNTESLIAKLQIQHPIIQAPMAGATHPNLVAAVANAGGLGSIPAGYLSAAKLKEYIRAVRAQTKNPISVNLFVPEQSVSLTKGVEESKAIVRECCEALGLPASFAEYNASNFDEQLAVVLEENIPIVSFTFGIPSKEVIRQLKQKNTYLLGTATTPREAIAFAEQDFDAIIAQGSEAGGHRGAFLKPVNHSLIGTMALIPEMVQAVSLPIIAAGGIMNGQGIAAALQLGASLVQMGTAFLPCHENELNAAYQQRLLTAKAEDTILTSVVSGKTVRGIENVLMMRLSALGENVPDYPVQHYLTQNLRRDAANQGNSDYMTLWAGQGVELSRVLSVDELIMCLLREANPLQ